MDFDSIERLIRRAANRLGVDIHRHRRTESEYFRLAQMLACHNVDLVLDVGANIGQFAMLLRESGYRGRLVSFEPLSVAHARLSENSRRYPNWEVAPRVALGDRDSEIEIHVAANSVSSSALAMLPVHIRAASNSDYVGSEWAPLARIDTISSGYMRTGSVAFLKIDTQGYEDRVIEGAMGCLSRIVGMQMELSLVSLYEDQQLFHPMVDRVCGLGFSIWAIWPCFNDARSGRTLQVNATFFRD